MNELLVLANCFALNYRELALAASYMVLPQIELPRVLLDTCIPRQTPGGIRRLPAFGFSTSSEVRPQSMNWLIKTVW